MRQIHFPAFQFGKTEMQTLYNIAAARSNLIHDLNQGHALVEEAKRKLNYCDLIERYITNDQPIKTSEAQD